MKKVILLLIVLTAIFHTRSFGKDPDGFALLSNSALSINIQNNFGYTPVEIGEAMDIPKFSDITEKGLVDWDQLNYKGLIQFYLHLSQDVSYGLELGFNRLYYWEERYKTAMDYDRWRWGTIWTWHMGGLIRFTIASQYYVMTGASIHTFMNDTGTTFGLPLAIGHEISISDFLTIPIEFRSDIIFGNATPIGIGGGIGIRYHID